jgi:hypothetical protein
MVLTGLISLFFIIEFVSATCRYWSYDSCQGDSNGYTDGHYSYSNSKSSNSYSSPTNSNSVFKGQNTKIYQIRRDYGYENPQGYYETHPVSAPTQYFSGGPYATMAGYGSFGSYYYQGYNGYSSGYSYFSGGYGYYNYW